MFFEVSPAILIAIFSYEVTCNWKCQLSDKKWNFKILINFNIFNLNFWSKLLFLTWISYSYLIRHIFKIQWWWCRLRKVDLSFTLYWNICRFRLTLVNSYKGNAVNWTFSFYQFFESPKSNLFLINLIICKCGP